MVTNTLVRKYLLVDLEYKLQSPTKRIASEILIYILSFECSPTIARQFTEKKKLQVLTNFKFKNQNFYL